jgi:hypothetical protein
LTTRRVATDWTRPAESPAYLLPEHRRDLVAVEPVEDAPGLLRVDEPLVDLARLLEGALDRIAGDLVEDHPADRHLRLQLLEQVPGDRLALAVLVRGEPCSARSSSRRSFVICSDFRDDA